jgi:hypothetical protein
MDPGALLRRSKKDAATNAAAQAEFNEKKSVPFSLQAKGTTH